MNITFSWILISKKVDIIGTYNLFFQTCTEYICKKNCSAHENVPSKNTWFVWVSSSDLRKKFPLRNFSTKINMFLVIFCFCKKATLLLSYL